MSLQKGYEPMSNTGEGRQLIGADIKQFVIAGDAIFSLKNTKSGNHLTYRITLAEGKTDFWFVSVLNGPDNTSNYAYIGTLKDDFYTSGLKFTWGKKSKIPETARCVGVMHEFIARLNRHNLPKTVEFWHNGKCARCARLLTDPESIEFGWGPICRKGM